MAKYEFDLFNTTPHIKLAKITTTDLKLSGKRVLVIGNTEIGYQMDIEEAISLFCSKIRELVTQHSCTDVLILGNIFRIKIKNPQNVLQQFFSNLSQIECKFHILPSPYLQKTIKSSNFPSIEIIQTLTACLALNLSSDPCNIYFTHNIGNDILVSEDAGCNFMMFLKQCYQQTIKPDDYLVSSNVQPAFCDLYQKVASPGSFNAENNFSQYLFFDFSDGLSLEVVSTVEKGVHEEPVNRSNKSQPRQSDCCRIL